MTSSAPPPDAPPAAGSDELAAALVPVAARLTGGPVRALTRGGRGGNNRIYRVEGADGRGYALKCYPPAADDPRDRLGTEFGGLRFLADQGESCTPAALAADRAANVALYEWVDGAPVAAATINAPVAAATINTPIAAATAADIDAALAFAGRLRGYADRPAAAALPPAAEATLSGRELTAQVARRLDRLNAVAADRPDLAALLRDGVAPAFDRWRRPAETDWGDDIPPAARTLSPSDFGFHNALRRPDGGLTFVDFEYFGWDDPVRLTADFLLHPGMALDDGLKARFFAGAAAIFAADPAFSPRFSVLYPLIGLRWCLIILNEFLPERWSRRAFAGAGHRAEAEAGQLAKARSLLELLHKYDGRPFRAC